MQSDFQESLAPVAEAPGVFDVGLFDVTGTLVAYHGSALSSPASMSFGRRLTTLFDTLWDNLEPAAEVVLTFDGFSLMLRSQKPYLLFVMVQRPLNLEAVRIAANTTLKQLRGLEPRSLQAPRVPTLPSASSAAPSARGLTKPGRPPASAAAPSAKPSSGQGSPPVKPAKKKSDIWG